MLTTLIFLNLKWFFEILLKIDQKFTIKLIVANKWQHLYGTVHLSPRFAQRSSRKNTQQAIFKTRKN